MWNQHRQEKSAIIAYLLWMFGGIAGFHHFYLNRDKHAFVWLTTLGGGLGVGWLGEIFFIRKYVKMANEDPEYLKEFHEKVRRNKKPPFSANRFIGMVMVAYVWGRVFHVAIPKDDFGSINWTFLNWLTPVTVALGVWFVGNIGKEKGTIWMALVGAAVCTPLRYYSSDEVLNLSIMVIVSALAFDSFSKQWRSEPKRKVSLHRRIITYSCCIILYLSLLFSGVYFNETITDNDGNEIPIHDAFREFFSRAWWLDLFESLCDTYRFALHHGWYETLKQLMDLTDSFKEQNAYKVLGVGPNSSQQDITAAWRKLSKESHPDKVKNELHRKEAQDKFMEIQQAYQILSRSKHRRSKKNKADNSEL